MFRLSIDANLIAKGVTMAQAYYLVGEVLGRLGLPEYAELVAFDTDGLSSLESRIPATAKRSAFNYAKCGVTRGRLFSLRMLKP